ncbi:hypothetical protein ABZ894_10835 [Nocardia beijingensis]|uniref:hypothetical protein n=1 Tax=Nocardia beijingensis TaxID=95162 RepID=UPI0033D4E606
MKHAGMRIIAAATIALTAVPATATAEISAEPVAAVVEVPPGVVDAVRGAIASVLFFGIVGLCLVRVLPADQCHLF